MMNEQKQTKLPKAGATLALALDAVFVVIFAMSGRSQHGEATTLAGVWHTAWPFLLALLVIWLLARAWRKPTAIVRAGIPVWLGTVALGMLFRAWLAGGGVAVSFVLVATGVLGVMLVGWRLIAALVRKLRR